MLNDPRYTDAIQEMSRIAQSDYERTRRELRYVAKALQGLIDSLGQRRSR